MLQLCFISLNLQSSSSRYISRRILYHSARLRTLRIMHTYGPIHLNFDAPLGKASHQRSRIARIISRQQYCSHRLLLLTNSTECRTFFCHPRMTANVHAFSRLSSCSRYMYLMSVAAGFQGCVCGASPLRRSL